MSVIMYSNNYKALYLLLGCVYTYMSLYVNEGPTVS